ncbi:DUF805 domain-containing protein [Leifsonia xyli]|uniref:DUF805 domain-containing protein n=1 Tax=Leifsonia xyli TaxID=1575 RepID=UPI003D67A3FD
MPLWAPLYGATFAQAIRRFFAKYADFTGRASRSEYWWWVLFSVLIGIGIELLSLVFALPGSHVDQQGSFSPGPLVALPAMLGIAWAIGTIVPGLALVWRRLHDANLAGPLFFLVFIPFFGGIVLLVLTLLPSQPGGARFDRPPAFPRYA